MQTVGLHQQCSPSPLAPSYASVAAVDVLGAEDARAASASGKRRSSKGKGGRVGGASGGGGGCSSGGGGGSRGGGGGGSGGGSGGFGSSGGGSGGGGISGGSGSGGSRAGTIQCGGSGGGQKLQKQQRPSETPSPQQLHEWISQRRASGGSGSCLYVIRTSDRAGQTCGKPHTQHRCSSRLDDTWRTEFSDEAERSRWAELLRSGVAIFDLDYDAILAAVYALYVSAEGDYYLCVPPDPSIEAAALGASDSALLGTMPAEAFHTFTLDSAASLCFFRDSTTLTPLSAPFLHCSLPVPPLFSRVRRFHLAHCQSFTSPRSLRTWSVPLPSRTRWSLPPLLGTLLWHHRLGHPSLPCLHCMHSRLLVSASPPALACLDVPSLRRGTADLPVLRLHSDRGREFSSDLLQDFCRGEGILQTFTLLAAPQQNGIAERHIGLVMEVARTSMIHAAAPHFMWTFAVRFTTPPRVVSSPLRKPHPLPGTVLVEVVFDSGAARSAASGGAEPGGAEPRGAEPRGAESEGSGSRGAEPGGAKTGGAELEGVEPGGAESRNTSSSGGPARTSPRPSPRPEPLSPKQLREWLAQRTRLRSGVAGAGVSSTGDTRAGGAGAGDPVEPGGIGAGGTGAGGAGAGGAGAGDTGAVGAGVGSIGTSGVGAGGAGAGDTGTVDPGAGGAGAGVAVSGGTGAGGTVRPQPFFAPLLHQVLGIPSFTALTPSLLCPPPDLS
ncbi:unnamed protein product [Closterium sp. NIES-53]